ncbi:calcium/sodium antiporter [Tepidimonas aquatica]|uniref:Inner membrane protein YrbG n=1 Tax=Tepidimonas aquatica TaxID=247482 RepID=A0A554WQY2_9BURK|nr:calcium/sodium antiporter [Tepidimonas aquatica]TSE25980.1 Inner membrane protein YrbG [Tepidimonas aquatica]
MTELAMPLLAVAVGLAVLVWSADRFVAAAAAIARHFGLPPLLIGAVIIGFGTSSPELAVSVLAALEGNPGIALGNAYGSNIANIGVILGLTAVLSPVAVHSQVLRQELPMLAGVTALAVALLWDLSVTRAEAALMLGVFAALMGWSIWQAMRGGADPLATETEAELAAHPMPIGRAWLELGVGLVLLVASSRALVWGAVAIAQSLGVSDLVIGLTIVAIGTSLPELASSIAAARKGEHDLALGNVIGSNLFNTLAVVGLAGVIAPMQAEAALLSRDVPVMAALTLVLFVLGWGWRGQPGRINRAEGALLLLAYVGYALWLVRDQLVAVA